MSTKAYRERREMHDEGKYYSEKYVPGCWYPVYALTSEELKDQRAAAKGKIHVPGCGVRAYVEKAGNVYILTSYRTQVAEIETLTDGSVTFRKTWEGYSVTTMKHINAFREMFSLPSLNKHAWIMMLSVYEEAQDH